MNKAYMENIIEQVKSVTAEVYTALEGRRNIILLLAILSIIVVSCGLSVFPEILKNKKE